MWDTLYVDQVVNQVFVRVCSTVHDDLAKARQEMLVVNHCLVTQFAGNHCAVTMHTDLYG
jgi:hypothetical protein